MTDDQGQPPSTNDAAPPTPSPQGETDEGPRSEILEHPKDPADVLLEDFRDGAAEPEPDLADLDFLHDDGTTYEFGDWCKFEYDKSDDEGDDPEIVKVPFAKHVWPTSTYKHVDDEEFGIRFAYRTDSGELEYATIDAGAFTDNTSKQRAGRELSRAGVHILEGRGKAFGRAMGAVRDAGVLDDLVHVTSTPGWHEDGAVYVSGETIVAEDDGEEWVAESDAPAIERRSGRQRSAAEWAEQAERVCTTPGLRAVVAVSLAGPLVEFVDDDSFIVHLAGPSSSGKSRAAKLAASIWGDPARLVETWDSTEKALSGLADVADGSCLVLDEIGEFDEGAKALHRAAYQIVAPKGRSRLHTTGELRETGRWRLTVLSTGEQRLKQRVGRFLKGGQIVRFLDLPIDVGDLTEDADHADEIDRVFTGRDGAFGHPGDAWTSYLVNELAPEDVAESRGRWKVALKGLRDGTPEGERILKRSALLGAALEHGREAALLPWDNETIDETVTWAADRIMSDRADQSTPNERAVDLLWEKVDTKPANYPTEKTLRTDDQHAEVWGVRQSNDVYVSETHLKASSIPVQAGVGARKWLEWATRNDHAEKVGRKRIAGIRKRWYCFTQND